MTNSKQTFYRGHMYFKLTSPLCCWHVMGEGHVYCYCNLTMFSCHWKTNRQNRYSNM